MRWAGTISPFMLALSFLSAHAQNRSGAPCALPESIKVDSFETASIERLERIIPVLEAHHNSHGFIVTYADPRSSLGAAEKRADLAKRQLLEKHEWIQSDPLNARVNTLVCGYRESPATELWVTPVGAAPPVCSPTVTVREKRPPTRSRRTR